MTARATQRVFTLTGLTVFAASVGAVTRSITTPSTPPSPTVNEVLTLVAPHPAGAEGFLGVVVTSSTIDLAPMTDGVVSAVYVRVGQAVKAGEAVASFENVELEQDVAMATAEAAKTEAEVQRASLERRHAVERAARAERARSVLNAEELAIARYGAAVARATERSLRAQLALVRAKVTHLHRRLEHRALRAPNDALVAERYVEAGSAVLAGNAVVRLVGQGESRVRFAVPESSAPLAEGDRVEVWWNSEALPAVVTTVAPTVDPASLTRFAEASLEHDGPPFGARVRVRRAHEP